jgi:hypothetical protein
MIGTKQPRHRGTGRAFSFLPGHRSGRTSGPLLLVAVVLITMLAPSPARAQFENSYPRPEYFVGLAALYDGDYQGATRSFQAALRSGRRLANFRWIDAICYLSMLGECQYQAGEPALAIDFYTQAIELHLSSPSWLMMLQFPPGLTQSSPIGPPITWGAKARRTIIGNFPEKVLIGQGRIDTERVLQEGGVAMQAQMLSVNANEIARCLALAIRRRAEILGPNAAHDPLTSRMITRLSLQSAPPNHWTQSWTECWLGLAYISANRHVEAVAALQSSLAVGGQYDHPLTATALVELGKLAFKHRRFEDAAVAFYEATFPAAFFQQFDILEESFRWGSITHLVGGGIGPYAPLAPAQLWARQRRLGQLQVSLMVENAEQLLQNGEAPAAATLLEQARRMTGRRAMGAGRVGTRLQFLAAVAQFQSGNIDAGNTALAPAIKLQQRSSLWLFQMAMADKLVVAGGVTERVADELYSYFLREPDPWDWLTNPQDTLAAWMTPNDALYERWFEVAVRRNEEEKALEISERLRRRHFLLSQPLGGRLLALRWLMEAPVTTLSESANLQRKAIMDRYPVYAALHRQVAAMRDELARDTLVPDDPDDQKLLAQKLAEIAKASATQERMLWRIAVGRDATELAFPRTFDAKRLRQTMPEGQVILSFFAARGSLFVFQLSRGEYRVWRVPAVGKIRGMVASTLRQMGNLDGNYAVAAKDLESDAWKQSSRELYQMLLNQESGSVRLPTEDCQELVIIPQGPIWYFPFEAVPLTEEGTYEPLLSRVRIRYLPMLSFAMPDQRGVPALAETVALAGKLHVKEDSGSSAEALADLATVLPDVKVYSPARIPSRYLAPFCQRLLVYAAIDDAPRKGPFGWSPLPGDRSNADGSLAAWMTLPWGAPAQLIVPGFATSAETSLKRGGGTGDELFLTSCGLLAAGSRTILMSRWRVGGKSSYSLINEFTQELPHLSAANAWQRAVQLTRMSELDLTREPRLNRSSFSESVDAQHPFFWAGYMLIDQARLAPGEEPPELPPEEPMMPPAEPADLLDPGAVPADGADPLDPDAEPAEGLIPIRPLDAPPALPGIEERLDADLLDPLAIGEPP